MKALNCIELAGQEKWSETLQYIEVDDPIPGNNEILIGLKAASVNFPDVLMVQGLYQFQPPMPFIPGAEAAGVVEKVGSGVTEFDEGDHVFVMTGNGCFAEKLVADQSRVQKIPKEMDLQVAAGLAMTYGTSLYALKQRANLQAGETLLVLGAAGGVGLAAVQLAKLSNAEVIAAVGSKEKAEFIKKYNPDLVINYREENLKETIENKYGKRPINIFYDQVGGEPYEEGLRLLSSEGKALIVGFASGNIPNQLLSYLLVKNITIMGVFMISFEDDDSAYLHSRMEALFKLYLEKKIDPVYETIPFEKIVDYLDLIGSRKTIGRIVATI